LVRVKKGEDPFSRGLIHPSSQALFEKKSHMVFPMEKLNDLFGTPSRQWLSFEWFLPAAFSHNGAGRLSCGNRMVSSALLLIRQPQ